MGNVIECFINYTLRAYNIKSFHKMMKLQEVLSFLEHEEKRKRLILKLKHSGEDSKEVHAFHEIIDSFNLNKVPKEINQTNILQNNFKFCDPLEAFKNCRLVSKT